MLQKERANHGKYFVCLSVLIMVVVFFLYVNCAGSYVPIMDCWRNIEEVGEKWINGVLTFSDVWNQSAMHRNPLFYVLFIADMQMFGLNMKVEVLAGAAVLVLCAVFIAFQFYRETSKGEKTKYIFFFTLALVLACLNMNQWEIQSEPFAISFYLRVSVYYTLFFVTNNLLLRKNSIPQFIAKTALLGLLLVISICMLSQAYFPGLVAAIIISLFLRYITTKKFRYLGGMLGLLAFSVIGISIYFYGLSVQPGIGPAKILTAVLNGTLIKGILLMAGSVLTQALLTANTNELLMLIIGAVIVVWTVIALILFFNKQLYNVSYFPLMCLIYCIVSMGTISAARVLAFDYTYLTASRYVVETSIGFVGLLWMTASIIPHIGRIPRNIFMALSVSSVILLLLSAGSELKMAPARRAYNDGLAVIMQNINAYTDEELQGFQASDPALVRDGVAFLRRNQLNIFKDAQKEPIEQDIGTYEDGWLAPEAILHYDTGERHELILKGYFPKQIDSTQTIDIYMDEVFITNFTVTEAQFEISIPVKSNQSITLRIKSNFSFQGDPPDQRELSFILVDTIWL